MSFLNKRVEDSIKQAKLLAQMSELSYRALNGTRQTRSNFINNDLKEQADTDKPAVGSLTSEMIAQYKREEEEKNKYVDPATGNELQYAPTGMTPTIKAAKLVPVTSLSAPATITDVQTEQSNYATILQGLKDKKQEIEDKKQEGKSKAKEVAEKNAKIKELSAIYNELKDNKTKLADKVKEFQKRLATLTGISKPKPEELEEMKELNKEIPELKTKIPELDKQLTDISTEHGTIRKAGLTLLAERKKLDADIVLKQLIYHY
jgi:chromosome segregation ATPase